MKKKILIIPNEFMLPVNSGGRLRTWNFIQALAPHFELSLLFLKRGDETIDDQYLNQAKQFFKNLWAVGPGSVPGACKSNSLDRIKNMLHGIPWEMAENPAENNFNEKLKEVLSNHSFDYVLVRYIYQAKYLFKHAGLLKGKIIFDIDDIEPRKALRTFKVEGFNGLYDRCRKRLNNFIFEVYHSRNLKTVKECLVCSKEDKTFIEHKGWFKNVTIIPNSVNMESFKINDAPLGGHTLLFCGALNYEPNIDGLLWFTKNALGPLKEMLPDVRLLIVGSKPIPEIMGLADGWSVFVHPDVPSVQPYYEQAHAVIAPIRIAGGTRIKILEAAAYRRPVVATTIGAEGLDIGHDKHCLIQDDPAGFARACCDVLTNRPLAQRLVQENYSFIRENYDLPVVARKINLLFNGSMS